MMLAIALVTATGLVLAYILGGRAWLKRRTWAAGFFAWIEPIEIRLWRKSETILWARFLQALGIVLTGLASLGTIDLSPLWPLLPDQLKWLPSLLPLIVTLAGLVNEQLRKYTTKPIEVVALPEALPAPVAMAVARAEVVNQQAVAVVEQAKMEEKL